MAKSKSIIQRRKTKVIEIGGVKIGGDNPIVVQSMTNTITSNLKATLAQIRRLKKVGCELVRVAVNDKDALLALKELVKRSPLPVIADIQFDWKLAVGAIEAGVAGLRLNPGNLRKKEHIKTVAKLAFERKIPIRVGVNAGSLDKELARKYGTGAKAMVESALREIKLLEDEGFDLIKVSLKSSDVSQTVLAYEMLAEKVEYPFHLGITEAGTILRGSVISALGIGILLWKGIGDTIRVSLSAPPEEEIRVAWMILSGLGLRQRGVRVIACPTCARAEFDVIKTAQKLEQALADIEKPLTIAVMGCIVNGPGEARLSDIGAVGTPKGIQIYLKGKKLSLVKQKEALSTLINLARKLESK